MSIDLNELIWAIINFLVMLAILGIFLWKPVLKVLDERRNEISDNLSNAESQRKKAEELLVQYQEQMEKASGEAHEIIAQAAKKAEAARDQIIAESRDEASKISEKAREEIKREKEQALKEVRDEVATLAVMAAGKILEKNITKDDHEKMLQEFLSEVGEVQ
ncbi:MAG: F0F1 ATP synthase subunit B [Clostridia bacterium]|nr:F0F1 ATP synthase subunit B [Clostridia bacterium]